MGKYVRWQAAVAVVGILLLGALLWYTAYTFPTKVIPARGGTYSEGVASNPQYLNPLLSHYNDIDRDLVALLFNGLTTLDERGVVVPDLAERWEAGADNLSYTFFLRPNVRWSDGAPFNADDVIFTVSVMQSDDYQWAPWLSALWKSVKATKVDEFTVTFTLSQPFAPFLDYTTIGLLPSHLWARYPVAELTSAQLNTRPVGTGPWQLTQIDADHVRLEPNPFFSGPLPYLSGIEFHFYPDTRRVLSAFSRHEINAIAHLYPDDVKSVLKEPELNLFSSTLPGYALIYLNLNSSNVPFFGDKAVRQALRAGLNRQQLIDEGLQGQGLIANSPIQPGNWAYDADVAQVSYNPAAARKLLADAGWTDSDADGISDKDGKPLRFVFLTTDAPDQVALGRLITQQWREIGVGVETQTTSFAGLAADYLSTHNFDAALVTWELSGDPDPYPLWHSTEIESGQNYARWNNRDADEAIEAARRTNDQTQRIELYRQFQVVFTDEAPALLLYHPVYTFGVESKVRGVTIGKLNRAADRFRTVSEWYIVTQRVSAGQAIRLDKSSP
ncbi:MAG: peptide ABC transporter substrate-binding protein [Anaerolineae bacterium]|uniref:peptide ABC transporter substrate-binding protein n=2 Tax=Candidatus Amarolinea dominans TaxID=3140696 RepID=UPI003136ABBB|nr:peptide ABC transporter substrate-binding protein [Anaerolineae bacterium]MBK9091702.1 peptide ABC transporter substrate-binding protein [Anaerolineae bacterium]MBK9233536.1 peptide ABC transporter substrate-binding protein [Anaerolineae bacterium]